MILNFVAFSLALLLPVSAHLSRNDRDEGIRTVGKRFESAEHKSIGDSITLQYQSSSINGSLFGYAVGQNVLSFGDIVALAGDYYGAWKRFGCADQISDLYDRNPDDGIALFITLANQLQGTDSNNTQYLNCILGYMVAEQEEIDAAIAAGQDPAQKYAEISEAYDYHYFSCGEAYAQIALCNWDHFGPNAISAYKAGHTAALSQSQAAQPTGNITMLTQAYFLEAFAQHYLTDLFAAGHTREPRRILHWTFFDDNETIPYPEPYPADRCAQRQHDEDNANGLWVSNSIGNSWASYGDKELFNSKSDANFVQATTASQAGLDEVFSAFNTGAVPSPDNYAALTVVPILDSLNDGYNSFPPMFRYSEDDPTHLYLRTNLDNRGLHDYTQYDKTPTWWQWRSILSLLDNSGVINNLHPFTKGFTSPQKIIHIREGQDPDLIVSIYGGSPVNSVPWNMLAQSVVSLPVTVGVTNWLSARNINTGGTSYSSNYVLIGRTNDTNLAQHVGLSITSDGPAQILWATTEKDGNDLWVQGETVVGQFSNGSDTSAMVKYFTDGPQGASKLELWAFLQGDEYSPTLMQPTLNTGRINIMISVNIQLFECPNVFVATGYDPTSQQTTWYIWSWDSEYSSQSALTILDDATSPPQALITNDALTGPNKAYQLLVRLFYGPTFNSSDQIQVDIVQLAFDTPMINLMSSQLFDITWNPVQSTTEYLNWNMTDVNQDGYPDLVGYISYSPNTIFQTIVFPGVGANGVLQSFSKPIVSDLTVSSDITNFFAGDFMTPIITSSVDFMYPDSITDISNSGIMSFFDNYGVLGVRMAAPTVSSGVFSYEFKGQTPGIAGQISSGLGWSPVDVMGTGGPQESVGFLVVTSPY